MSRETRNGQVGRTIARGAAWMLLVKVVARALGLVSTALLARLLTPADFGLVAIAMALFAFVGLFSEFGFDTQLIQRQDADRGHYDTAWTLNLGVGLVAAVLLLAAAPVIAATYGDPRLTTLLRCTALLFVLEGLQNIGVTNLRKELAFEREFLFTTLPRFAGFAVTVGLALAGAGYWALLAGIVAIRLCSTVLSYVMHPYRPRLCLAAAAELFHFSKWLIAGNVLRFIGGRGPLLLLGRTVSLEAAGLFSLARELPNAVVTEMVATINRATYPGYARVAVDRAALRALYLQVVGAVALYVFPAALGIALLAEPLVETLLGAQWLAAVAVVQVLAFANLFSGLNTNATYIYLALGRPRLLPTLSLLHIGVMVPGILLASPRYGLVGAAAAIVTASAITSLTSSVILRRQLDLGIADLGALFWRPLLGSAAMVSTLLMLLGTVPALRTAPAWVELLSCAAGGALVYAAVVALLWRLAGAPEGVESVLLRALRGRLVARVGT